MIHWDAYAGTGLINCGKRRNGKPHNVLVIEVIRALSKSGVAALQKAHPRLKFVRGGKP